VGQAGSLRGGCLPPPSLASAAVWPIANRPQLTKLPHNGALSFVLAMNRAGIHFDVAHPKLKSNLQNSAEPLR
jgi:hypothetical protein